MAYKEHVIEKVYFTIAEVAEPLGLATSNLRYWEDEFSWLRPKKGKKGNRQYTRKDINIVHDLNFLVHKRGMTIDGVKMAYVCDYYHELIAFFKTYEDVSP